MENEWVGRILGIGESLRLQVVMPCPRCAMPTLSQGNALPRDIGILRTIAQHNQQPVANEGTMGCAGAYAEVTQSGVIRRGDAVRLV